MVERCLSLRGRRFLLLVIAVLFSMAFPHDAFAAEQGYGSFWYGPNSQSVEGVKYIKTGVVASTKYDAALYALGFGSSTVKGLTNAKKNSLKANSTFSTFCNNFVIGKPDDDLTTIIPGLPTVGLNTDSMLSAWYAARAMYGESSCFWSVYSEDSADSAEDAAYRIIKGGSSSGGGSGSPSTGLSGWYRVKLSAVNEPYSGNMANTSVTVYNNPSTIKIDSNGKGTVSGGSSGNSITWNNCKEIYAYIDPYSYNLFGTLSQDNITYIRSFGTTYIIGSDGSYEWYKLNEDSNYGIENTSGEVNTFVQYNSSNSNVYRINNEVCIFFTNCSKNTSFSLVKDGKNNSPRKAFWLSEGTVDDPNVNPDPPIDWPDPTPTPTPPDPPDPVTPDPPNPWIPIPDEDIDITGEDFQDLIDALSEHCIHLQNSISSNISQLWSLQSDLFSDHMNTFWDNLHNDLLWLGECLNFDVNVNVDGGSGGDGGTEGGGEGDTNTYVPFDDSSVIYWLKQIWSKLPTGINTRPTDPVTNPTGWWDWLTQLLNNLAADLMALGHDSLAGVLETLNQLRNKFPFSLPWDVAAMLGLLVGPAVCPEFDMPCYAVSMEGLQEVGTYHVTLEAYENVWEGVRWIETIAFAVYLIMNTSNLMDMVQRTVRPR